MILGFIFAPQIRNVLGNLAKRIDQLQTAKGFGVELSFSAQMFSLVADAAALPATAGTAPGAPELPPGYLLPQEVKDAIKSLDGGSKPPEQPRKTAGEDADRRPSISLPDRVRYRTGDRDRWVKPVPLTADNLAGQAEVSPTITVLSAWAYFEAAINSLANELGISDEPSKVRAQLVIGALTERGASLPSNMLRVVERLRSLMETAARGKPVTKLEALDYAAFALRHAKILLGAWERTSEPATGPAPDIEPAERAKPPVH